MKPLPPARIPRRGRLRLALVLTSTVLTLAAACGKEAAPPAETPASPPQATAPEKTVPVKTVPQAPPSNPPTVPPIAPPVAAPKEEAPAANPKPPQDPAPTPAPEHPAPPSEPAAEAVAPPPPPKPVPADVAAAIAKIRGEIARHDLTAAQETARESEKHLGESAALRLAAARVHLALAEEEMNGANEAFTVQSHVADADQRRMQAQALDPEVAGGAAVRAQILRFEEKPDLAKKLLAEHLATHAADAEAVAILGEMATNARDWREADARWTRVCELDPADGRARLEATLAKQWNGMSAPDVAKGYLEACRLLPDDERAIKALAGVYPKDRERKLELLRKVVEQNPGAVWARVWIAYVLRKEGKPDLAAAAKLLGEAVKLAPKNAGVHVNLAETLSDAGAPPGEVLDEYSAAAENSAPGTVSKFAAIADKILHQSRDPEIVTRAQRVRAYDALVPKMTGEGWFANNAGLWFRDVGKNFELSLRYYKASVAAQPDDQDFINDCALIYLFHLTDRKDECLPMFEKVRALVEKEGQDPVRGYWDTLENLCKYWYEKGDYAKTIECATKRANPAAAVDGTPYPSAKAAGYKAMAEKALKKR